MYACRSTERDKLTGLDNHLFHIKHYWYASVTSLFDCNKNELGRISRDHTRSPQYIGKPADFQKSVNICESRTIEQRKYSLIKYRTSCGDRTRFIQDQSLGFRFIHRIIAGFYIVFHFWQPYWKKWWKYVSHIFRFVKKRWAHSQHRRAAHIATTDASNMPPSKSRQQTSQYNIQTNFSFEIHSCFGSIHLEFFIKSSTIALNTCASSFAMPGRNFGEHNGVKSMFGTKYPFSGSMTVGWVNSCA